MRARLSGREIVDAAPGRWAMLAMLAALAALAMPGCDSESSESIDAIADLDLSHSFHVTLQLEYENPSPFPWEAPGALGFWLRIDDSAGGSQAMAGSRDNTRAALQGPVHSVVFERKDSGERALVTPFDVLGSRPYDRLTQEPLCWQKAYWLTIETLSLIPMDSDRDGLVDGVTGSATGTFTAVDGDRSYVTPFTATAEGPLDTEAPYAMLMDAAPGRVFTVVDPMVFLVSEPLPLSVQGRLVASTGEIVTMQLERRPANAPAFTALHFTPETSLAFDTRYTLEFVSDSGPGPALVDMAGNSNRNPGVWFRTMPDPGLFAEDGFEGALAMVSEGNVKVVSSLGTMPAISGQRSVVLGGGSRIALRVPVNPGDGYLRMNARALSSGFFTLWAEVTVHGASRDEISVLSLQEPFAGVDFSPIDHAIWTHASPTQTIEVPLPATTASEVLVVIEVESNVCRAPDGGLGLFMDDVRVE